jgi:CspA family cold shock protein
MIEVFSQELIRAALASRPFVFSKRIDMSIGTVKWFNVQKGYGFIQPQDASKDVFVHISALERAGIDQLREGQKVSYEIQQDRGKPSAVNLKLAD